MLVKASQPRLLQASRRYQNVECGNLNMLYLKALTHWQSSLWRLWNINGWRYISSSSSSINSSSNSSSGSSSSISSNITVVVVAVVVLAVTLTVVVVAAVVIVAVLAVVVVRINFEKCVWNTGFNFIQFMFSQYANTSLTTAICCV